MMALFFLRCSRVEFKQVAVHTASDFRVENTKMPGEVKLRTKHVRNAAYIWQYRVSTVSAWTTAPVTNKASTVISGLTSSTRYSFRVAVIAHNHQGPWSNVLDLMVM